MKSIYKSYIENIDIVDKIIFYDYKYLDANGNNISHIKMFEVTRILKEILNFDLIIKEKEIFNKQMAKILLFVYQKGTKDYQNTYNNIILGEINEKIQR